jgi:mycothione reductase
MKEYDVIVIGSGVGLGVVFNALSEGLKVALIDKGNLGGTCLNVGCVPSKMLTATADRIAEIRDASKFGIRAEIRGIDFDAIMDRMRGTIREGRNSLRQAIEESENLDYYNSEARFAGDHVLEMESGRIKGEKNFIAAGTRPLIPPLKGLDKAPYLTNETVLDIGRKPDSIVIIGGGYVAAEYGHFFASLGTRVTIIQRIERLVPFEDPEISALLAQDLKTRMGIYTGAEAVEVLNRPGGCAVVMRDRKTGAENEITAQTAMVATGRRSNADSLSVEKTGVATTAAGFISVDDYLLTSRENIWAFGDILGRQMFTHAGDKEAEIAWHNATHEEKIRMDFALIPHAVFTYPQIASVGMTEEEARKDYDILVGRAKYSDTVKGEAIIEKEGFAKAVVEKSSGKILGFHIIGPEASILIQEVVNAMANGQDVKSITGSMHIFSALSEVISETLEENLA